MHRFVNEQLYPYSAFYRRLFDENKIDPRSIRTVDDLRRVPFTTKRDIAPTADNPTRHLDLVLHPDLEKLRQFAPKGKLIDLLWTKLIAGDAAAERKVLLEYGPVHVIFTTGRTALPTQFVYAPPDFHRLHVVGKRIADYREDVTDLLQWVGLGDRMHSYPSILSGGEKQRAAIARAVIGKPELLLADEPTGNVDPQMARRLLRLFIELNRLGTSVLIATHDHQLMRQFKAPRLELHEGHVRIV